MFDTQLLIYAYFEYITNKHENTENCPVHVYVNEIANGIAFKSKVII